LQRVDLAYADPKLVPLLLTDGERDVLEALVRKLKMSADYFSARRIYGADINPAPHLDTDRVTTFVTD
jgi:hypothetical protein